VVATQGSRMTDASTPHMAPHMAINGSMESAAIHKESTTASFISTSSCATSGANGSFRQLLHQLEQEHIRELIMVRCAQEAELTTLRAEVAELRAQRVASAVEACITQSAGSLCTTPRTGNNGCNVATSARQKRPSADGIVEQQHQQQQQQQQQQQPLQCIVQPPSVTPRAQAPPAAVRTAPVSPRAWQATSGSMCLPQRSVGAVEDPSFAGLASVLQAASYTPQPVTATPVAARTMSRHLISATPPPRQRQVAMATSLSFIPVHSSASSPPQALPPGMVTALRPAGSSLQALPSSPSSQQALHPESPAAAGAGMSPTASAAAMATSASARARATADKATPRNLEMEAMPSQPTASAAKQSTAREESDVTTGSGGSSEAIAAPVMERSSAARRVNSLSTPRRKD